MKTKVNLVRRFLMRFLTSSVGNPVTNKEVASFRSLTIDHVLIVRPNSRLGNQILLTPLLQEITYYFPDCKIDVFVRGGLASILFKNYTNIRHIIKLPSQPFKHLLEYANTWFSVRKHRYDLVINVDESSSSGRMLTRIARADIKFFYEEEFVEDSKQEQPSDYIHMGKRPVYNFRSFLNKAGYKLDDRPIPFLSLKLDNSELAKGAQLLTEMVDNGKPTICIYTFATGTKCYSKEWWKEIYSRLKQKYEAEYNILEVLPKENISQIDFEATAYYSTNIREMGAVIAKSAIFISADCGVMHLASSVGVPTVGLFSFSNIDMYNPYNTNSLAIDVSKTDVADIINNVDKILKK